MSHADDVDVERLMLGARLDDAAAVKLRVVVIVRSGEANGRMRIRGVVEK
jgi:hypothetical protein